jgi:hypothetical protein
VTIATAILHGLLHNLPSQGQPKRSCSPSASYGDPSKIGHKKSHTLPTTRSYTRSRITHPTLLYKRLPLHTANCKRLHIPYRHGAGTGTNTLCREIPYRTIQYVPVRYAYLLIARLGQGLRDMLAHGHGESTSQSGIGSHTPPTQDTPVLRLGGEGNTTPPLPQNHSRGDCIHILHTHLHERVFALLATLANAIWRAVSDLFTHTGTFSSLGQRHPRAPLKVRLRIGYRLFLYRDIYRDNIGIDIIGYDFENNRYNRLCFSK